MKAITGTTRIFPVIGWPVEQVKAPTLFNAYFEHHGIDARVIPFKIEPERYCEAVRMFMKTENVGGIFVSIPHKPMTLEAVEQSTLRARVAGACNAVYRDADGVIWGDLIDGEGFIRALGRTAADRPLVWNKTRALVVGTGGVGCAIVASLAAQGVAEISVFDTNRAGAEALLARTAAAFPATRVGFAQPDASGFDLLVNCTPLGMHVGDPMPFALEGVRRDAIVADCGMKIEMSQLLVQAQALGCRIQKGKEMLIEQAPLYLDLFGWPGVAADDFRALEAL
ncbi:shikimate dehydrogenase family protein [Herbaspirillum seropedicae]|uniref:shikimate dehydrogenase family protein n=1 Tax=Herbaspirillum seropedicae TaxID=964 RepID=UPI00285B03CF|nr:shikimate dehydrogenase [Herbaspirillum seropedicae]MDR6395521.1 shikimate dehydrogenase [Herbaspirillum seropedicae]